MTCRCCTVDKGGGVGGAAGVVDSSAGVVDSDSGAGV